jgi:hypothetical protein
LDCQMLGDVDKEMMRRVAYLSLELEGEFWVYTVRRSEKSFLNTFYEALNSNYNPHQLTHQSILPPTPQTTPSVLLCFCPCSRLHIPQTAHVIPACATNITAENTNPI